MPPGRKPKPVEQRRKEGNPGKRPMPEPVVVGGRPSTLPDPPAHMPEDAKEAWRKIVPTLSNIGILDNVDEMALEAMCTQFARARQAGRVIGKKGPLARGSQGQVVEHPAMASERAAHKLFLQFAEHYALTPVARTRLGLAELQRKTLSQELTESLDVDLEEVTDAEVVAG